MIRRVRVTNYRSLAQVTVDLDPFTILVGPNGAGKSNFVDALRFVSDCLTSTVASALQQRGGIGAVRRRSIGHPTNFGVKVELEIDHNDSAIYDFLIAAQPHGDFVVKREICKVWSGALGRPHQFERKDDELSTTVTGKPPRVAQDRLMLTVLSGYTEFRPLYDKLTQMQFYALVPERIREYQDSDSGHVLKRDGSNAAAVLREVSRTARIDYERLCSLLGEVVPGTKRAEYHAVGNKETISFRQDVGDKEPWTFDALNMSDGTLRVLGVLLAIYQQPTPSFVAIEEPESTIHPAAIDVLVDIFAEAQSRTQLLITTHSPDILDNKAIEDHQIRVVEVENGKTMISPLGFLPREAIRKKLYGAGELLRMGQLSGDREQDPSREKQARLAG